MRILCAYVPDGLRPETEVALKEHAPGLTDWHAVSPQDPLAYPRLVAHYWRTGKDFAVVEQDIVVRADVIDAFLNCPEPWCAYPYAWTTNVGVALGCNRFRSELLSKYPGAADGAHHVGWWQFDVVFLRRILAGEHGLQPHVHLPPVEHLNEAKKLLPDADPTPLMHMPSDIGNLR